MTRKVLLSLLTLLATAACDRLENVGRVPDFTPADTSTEAQAMQLADTGGFYRSDPRDQSSLWTGERGSLLGDRRAERQGDILTVVVQIDDRAEISNASQRSRNGSERSGVSSLLGLPQIVDRVLPNGASTADAASFDSSSSSKGAGSVSRNEKLTLKVAATVTAVLPNGVLRIQGSQEVRVNFEIRELLVTGYVRPGDISRRNEITYDKIAAARISYGGRGQITDVQQPRYGQQIADIVLPF